MATEREIDLEILALIPHRPPMLLIETLLAVSATQASAELVIGAQSHFYEADHGVPAWVGLEYMGQTAALIAGHQQRVGDCPPHLGFLLGCRTYQSQVGFFAPQKKLIIKASQATIVGESLATFNCTITDASNNNELANALLSVYRRPIE